MNIIKTISIDRLSEREVVLCEDKRIVVDGQNISLGAEKTFIPNTSTGRERLAEMTTDNPNIYQAVMVMWGDEPVIDENALG